MRVWLDPDRLQSLGLTANDVVAALQGQNVQVASGVLNQPPVEKPRRLPDRGADARAAQPIRTSSAISSSSRPRMRWCASRTLRRVELAAQDYSTELLSRPRSGGRARRVPAARLERAGDREGDPHAMAELAQAVSARREIRHRLRSDAVHPAVGRCGARRRSSRPSSSSCSWSCCSCRPGARR